jgi:molecular chaperone HscB
MMNFFEVFGLERKLEIDAAQLQRRFYELSREHHPDFHQGAPADQQAQVLEASARVNAAYRALRDPVARVEYLVRLEEGRETDTVDGHGPSRSKDGDTVKPKAPPELLEEMFEIQEALQEARSGGLDEPTRATLTAQRERLITRRAAEEARITGELSTAWDAATPAERPKLLAAFKETLSTRAYLRTVIDDLADALGGPNALGGTGEGHVAHHRY